MSNPYYTVTGAPTTQSRGYSATIRSEYGLIATGFDAVYTAMLLRGLKAGETWTGTHVFTGATVTFATQSALDNSTKAATTAYADSAVSASAVTLNAAIALKADIASPTFTGTPAAPTASLGTSTTQIATTAFVAGTAFSAALPSQTGNSGKFVTTDGTNASWSAVLPSQTSNSGKFLTTNGTAASWSAVLPSQTSNSGKFLTTNGTTASWAYSNVASVTTATTATTLTSTATLLKITPASYGVAVTLPDATTCNVGGPLHIIDNKGAYPVRVLNSAGTLLGFVYGGVVSHVSLSDKSTAAGVWTIENNELVGASAQLLTTNMAAIDAVIDIGSNQEVIIGRGVSSANCYGVVYNRSTNTFGSVTLIRTATFGSSLIAACLSGTNQVLVCSVASGATTFEAVTLSISGTTITVNTAATATLSANINTFADGCGLIAVGSSFVTSYTVATPAAQIRALSISGTTVTIGSATVLDGTAGGLIVASGSVVIAASTSSSVANVFTKPYTVSGSTLSAGTGTSTAKQLAAHTLRFFVGLASGRFALAVTSSGANTDAAIVTLAGTTTTISFLTAMMGSNCVDAIAVSTNKILLLGGNIGDNANILTDTAGTASAGTAITLSSQTVRACLYVSGTDVVVGEGAASNPVYIQVVSCSGASPVLSQTLRMDNGNSTVYSTAPFSNSNSNSVLSKNPNLVFGTTFAQQLFSQAGAWTFLTRARGFSASLVTSNYPLGANFSARYRGKSDSERWTSDAATVITKIECVA